MHLLSHTREFHGKMIKTMVAGTGMPSPASVSRCICLLDQRILTVTVDRDCRPCRVRYGNRPPLLVVETAQRRLRDEFPTQA
jgi:hypothetical protein